MEDGKVLVKRSIYNGKVNALYSFVPCETVMVTGRVGQFPIESSETNGEIERIDSPAIDRIDYKRFEGYTEPEENGEIDITKSEILVSVGRGIKNKESIAMAEELARILGADLACTRPVSDNDWLPKAYHVGLSGKTVKPRVYLALGISGAFQHVVGIDKSDVIVAINKDPKAPIFNVADFGIVNDLFEVVPPLVQTIREMISAQN